MSKPGVTIAIPNWNHELMLPRCLGRALEGLEALRRWGCQGEVLVIDDASRDGSLTLLRQLEALYFANGLRVLSLAENQGLAAVRNVALRSARFSSVAFVDADDELVPENLPCFWRALRGTSAAAVYGNICRRKIETGEVYDVFSNEGFNDRIYEKNYIASFGMFDRDQVLDVGGYSEKFTTLEDYEMWLHLACHGRRIVFVPVVMGYYDTLPDSMLANQGAAASAQRALARIFNQTGTRSLMPLNTRRLCYHPDVGYI